MAGRFSRRTLVASTALLVLSGCSRVSLTKAGPTRSTDPRQAIRDYFSLLSQGQYADGQRLLTPAYQARLGAAGVNVLVHSVKSAQVTDMVDAVEWANGLGARLPSPPSDAREYLVTLQIEPTNAADKTWAAGLNRRFIDAVARESSWQLDGMDVKPGPLVTGSAAASPADPTRTVVVPTALLRLGPAPVDRYIYTARQHAADLGQIPWATDPVDVVHRDGPSFGINAADLATLLSKNVDPATLVPRASVLVAHDDRPLLVTVEQPIRSGPGGVWAIASVQVAPPFPASGK